MHTQVMCGIAVPGVSLLAYNYFITDDFLYFYHVCFAISSHLSRQNQESGDET